MAKSISEEELQLKKRARRRLIGAIALVVIIAVFLPMVLEHEPKPAVQNIDIQIPSPNNAGTFTSKIVPVTDPPTSSAEAPPPVVPEAASPATALPSAESSVPVAAKPLPIKPAQPTADKTSEEKSSLTPSPTPSPSVPAKAIVKLPEKAKAPDKPKVVEKTKSPAKAKTAEKPKAETTAGGFVVQVAALNDAAKAKQIQQQMTGAGLKTFTETVPTAKGSVTRVRAGPFMTRDEAEQTRDKLKSIGLSSNIVPK